MNRGHPAPAAPPAPVRTAEPAAADRPLRIAFLVPEDRQTGTYFRFSNLASGLVRLGHTVTVYTQTNESRWRGRRETRAGVPFVLGPTVPGNRVLMAPIHPGNIARRLVARVAPADVYHLFQPYPTSALAWLRLRERRAGIFAYDWDDYWMNEEFGLLRPRDLNTRVTAIWVRFLERYLPQKCDLLTTLSHAIAALAHRFRSPAVTIAYNGIWSEEPLDRGEARAGLGLDGGAIYAGMMGWSGEMRWALDGLRACLERFPRLRLAWCGQDPSAVLRDYPDVVQRVDFLGFLGGGRLKAFRCALDLGIIPMADTAFNRFRLPYKLTDFLSAGTPVLASDVGETAILGRQLAGVALCAPNRPAWIEAFAKAIDGLGHGTFSHRVDLARLAADFDWTAIARRLVDCYRERLAAKPVLA